MPKKSKTEQDGGAIPFTGNETMVEAFARPEGEFVVKSSLRFYSYKTVLTKAWLSNFEGIPRKSVQDVLSNAVNGLAEANKTNSSLTIKQLINMAKAQVEQMPRDAFAVAPTAPTAPLTAPGQKRVRKSSSPMMADKGLSPDSMARTEAPVRPVKPVKRKMPKTVVPAPLVASPPRVQSPPALASPPRQVRASPPNQFEEQANALADLMKETISLKKQVSTKTERTLLKDISAAQKKYEIAKAKEAATAKKEVEKTKRAKKQQVRKEVSDITEALGKL